jgi:hypothetical protein
MRAPTANVNAPGERELAGAIDRAGDVRASDRDSQRRDVEDAAVVASIVEGLRPTPLTRPVITAPLAEPPLRVGPVGFRDDDDSQHAEQARSARIAGSSLCS